MFQELLDNALEFIGYHSERQGCTGDELLSFISLDILPRYGLGGHTDVQLAVMGLLQHRSTCFTVRHRGDIVPVGELPNAILAYEQCVFYPTQSLQEKTVGCSLRTVSVRAAVNHACENMLNGFSRSGTRKNSVVGGQSAHAAGVGMGTRVLLKEKWLKHVFVYDKEVKMFALCLMPFFAIPVLHGQTYVTPFQSYIARRREEAHKGRIYIAASEARQVVLSTPEHRLVFLDAVHAVFASRGCVLPMGLQGWQRKGAVRMFRAAGLRIVRASIVSGCKTHSVPMVVDGRTGPGGASELRDGPEEGDGDDDGKDSEDGSSDDGCVKSDSGESRDGNDSVDGERCDMELDEAPIDPQHEAPAHFFADPAYPLPLQVVKQAEVYPVTLESVVPNVLACSRVGIGKELSGFAHSYERRWKTIEKSLVLSRYGKSFTLLLRPIGWSDKRSDACGDRRWDESLPRGVSEWSVKALLEAVNSAPMRAVSLRELRSVVDRRTVGRLLPFLRSEGLLSTTGVTLPHGKRIGILVAAGVELTEEDRTGIVERYMNKFFCRSKATDSVVKLQHIPPPMDNESALKRTLMKFKCSSQTVRLVTKITMMRNGFSCMEVLRRSRLHLELCRLWCRFNVEPNTTLSLDLLLQEMSLSSFCIVVGVGGVDLASYINEGRCTWGTSINCLPPTLQVHCRHSALQPLAYSLSLLQSSGLVVCNQKINVDMHIKPDELLISLASTIAEPWEVQSDDELMVQDRLPREYVFFPNGEASQPQETCKAVMQYWKKQWERAAMVTAPRRWLAAFFRDVVRLEPNVSNAQILAISRKFRIHFNVVAEFILQRLGRLRVQGPDPRLHGRASSRAGARNAEDGQGFSTKIVNRRKLELTGATLADIIVNGLQSGGLNSSLVRVHSKLSRQGRISNLGEHNPYSNRAHNGMLAIVESITNTVKVPREAVSTGKLSVTLKKAVLSVVSPDLAAPEVQPQVNVGVAQPSPGANEMKGSPLVASSMEKTKSAGKCNDPPELLQDIVRMILLSDEIHYDAVAAKALLSQFSDGEVERCVECLLSFPSFRSRSANGGRLPHIELSSMCRLLPMKYNNTVPPSRAVSLDYAHNMTVSLLFLPQSNCQRWCVPPVLHPDKSLQDYEPRLLEQPFFDLRLLSCNGQEAAELGMIRIPRFAPPIRSVDEQRAAKVTPTPVGRTPTTSSALHPTNAACLPGGSSAPSTDGLYPARSLLRPWKRLRYLDLADIPVDPAPTPEQLHRARNVKIEPTETATKAAPCSLQFPSVFHHVDGSFHDFFWRSFLFAVYTVVHSSPGITEDQLIRELLLSGLVSRTACEVAVNFLTSSLVINARKILQSCDEGLSPFRDNVSTQIKGNKSEKSAMRYVNCYFCVLSPEGPWNIMDL
uniref:Uncharacterized protein TCIL3000_11_4610 n=1 Tax=Trypanosoma congolense (strain IL3000) TaxID=1068625 RepID=G0V085_TRYCI|nr:unnamed protein product [Trypanosoma congolense IL3000]